MRIARAARSGRWIPLAVFVAGMAAAVWLSSSLRAAENARLTFVAEETVSAAVIDLRTGMESLFETFARAARTHGDTMLRQRGAWSLELTGLEGSAWVAPSGQVQAIHPRAGNDDLAGFGSDGAGREAMAVARATRRPVATGSVVRADGDSTFHVVVPVFAAEDLTGFVVGSFSGPRLFASGLPPPRSSHRAIGVFENGREIHRSGTPAAGWFAEATLPVLGVERVVKAGPTALALAGMRSALPAVVLAGGAILALLLASSVAFAQAARRRAARAEIAEGALRLSEAQYRLLFESNPSPMWVYDERSLAFLAVNEAAIEKYGYSREEFLGMTIRDIRPPETVPLLEAALVRRRAERGQTGTRQTWKHLTKAGRVIEVEMAGHPLWFQSREAWLALANDVTDRKRLEGQLLQSQKMESVGRLAGGVAHDFNNLLGVIIGYGELLRRDLGHVQPAAARLEEILNAADRAAALTRQLLAFSRKQILEPTVLDLNLVVTDIEKLLRRVIGEDVQLVTAVGEGRDLVQADRGQLEQVIVNLAVNARDAMPHGGKLILETGAVELDEAYAATRPDARVGPHVMLAVSDTGHGMDASTLSHMFEPFFTTKPAGKGTGLGLAMVHGIVHQSGGHVMVYSEVGRGTTFRIYLPRYDGEGAPAAASPARARAPGGTETILVVEDEWSLRVMIGEVLAGNGYTVVEAATPEEAVAAARAERQPIALVITDVVLPGQSGPQVAAAVRALRPEVRVLYMSGYTDDAIGQQGVLEPGVSFLQKPFMTEQLLRKVREVLEIPAAL